MHQHPQANPVGKIAKAFALGFLLGSAFMASPALGASFCALALIYLLIVGGKARDRQ